MSSSCSCFCIIQHLNLLQLRVIFFGYSMRGERKGCCCWADFQCHLMPENFQASSRMKVSVTIFLKISLFICLKTSLKSFVKTSGRRVGDKSIWITQIQLGVWWLFFYLTLLSRMENSSDYFEAVWRVKSTGDWLVKQLQTLPSKWNHRALTSVIKCFQYSLGCGTTVSLNHLWKRKK